MLNRMVWSIVGVCVLGCSSVPAGRPGLSDAGTADQSIDTGIGGGMDAKIEAGADASPDVPVEVLDATHGPDAPAGMDGATCEGSVCSGACVDTSTALAHCGM